MRTSNYRKKLDKKVWRIIWGTAGGFVLAGIIFFFAYFNVTHVEVVASTHYTEEEIREMVLTGPLASNSVLAPLLYSKDNVEDVPYVEKFEVTRVSHNTIAVSVKETEAVGCIPYLDCYIYFDREGVMIDSSVERDEVIPYFDGIKVAYVVKGKKLPIEGDTVLNTAISLARIFEKNDRIPDNISFDENYQITLQYGDIQVELGQDQYLEDKMEKVIAIPPLLEGKKGILHLENVSDSVQKVTFEEEVEETDETSDQGDTSGESDSTDTSEETSSDDGSYDDGSYSDGSYDDGSYSDGSYDDGSYSDGSYDDGSYSDGSYDDGSYSDGSYDDGSYSDGSYDDGSYSDGSYDDGSYSDGSYDDGSYDYGSDYSDENYGEGYY